MKNIYIIVIIILSSGLTSCRKYVDDFRTKGYLTATGAISYRYLLNNTQTFEQTASLMDFSSDDVLFADEQQETDMSLSYQYPQMTQAYIWANQYYAPNVSDEDWDKLYRVIFNCNTVITEVPKTTDQSASYKNELIAEALVHRADAYLQLVNMYANTYTTATAATDLGVPLITEVTVDQNLNRSTVKQVYDQIFSDLNTAVISLPAKSTYNTIPSQAAAYALLARAYLLTGDYASALSNAQKSLSVKSSLNDLNDFINGGYPARKVDPEIILSKTVSEAFLYGGPVFLRLNDDLLNLLGTKDLRYQIFTQPATNEDPSYTGRMFWKELLTGENRNTGTSVPEMMLVSAECEARAGNAGSAISMLNALRKKRFAPADYVAYNVTTPDAALVLALEERRRELFCRGYRWFDQKRLNKESGFSKTVTHTFLGTNYTLDPGSNRYLYPIATYYFQFNKFLIQNPR